MAKMKLLCEVLWAMIQVIIDVWASPSQRRHGSGRSPANQAAAKTNATKIMTCCPVTSNWGLSLTALRLRFQPCLATGSKNGSPFFQVWGLSPLSRLLPIDNVKRLPYDHTNQRTPLVRSITAELATWNKVVLAACKTLASRVFVLDARAVFGSSNGSAAPNESPLTPAAPYRIAAALKGCPSTRCAPS